MQLTFSLQLPGIPRFSDGPEFFRGHFILNKMDSKQPGGFSETSFGDENSALNMLSLKAHPEMIYLIRFHFRVASPEIDSSP
jgi:hypothetical protein